MTLPDLIAALEAAQGPSRELDAEIHAAVGRNVLPPVPEGEPWRHTVYTASGWLTPLNYTRSLDAALSLVPEGAVWRIAILTDYELPGRASIYDIKDGHDSYHVQADARSPALALCIAALRARLSAADRPGETEVGK